MREPGTPSKASDLGSFPYFIEEKTLWRRDLMFHAHFTADVVGPS